MNCQYGRMYQGVSSVSSYIFYNNNNNNNSNNNNNNNNNNINRSRKKCPVVKEGLIKFIIFAKI